MEEVRFAFTLTVFLVWYPIARVAGDRVPDQKDGEREGEPHFLHPSSPRSLAVG